MRFIRYILLLILLSCNSVKKDTGTTAERPVSVKPVVIDYVFNWKTNGEIGVLNYQIQRSPSKGKWTTLGTITPKYQKDTNSYVFTLPATKVNYYYRLVTNTINKKVIYATQPIYIKLK